MKTTILLAALAALTCPIWAQTSPGPNMPAIHERPSAQDKPARMVGSTGDQPFFATGEIDPTNTLTLGTGTWTTTGTVQDDLGRTMAEVDNAGKVVIHPGYTPEQVIARILSVYIDQANLNAVSDKRLFSQTENLLKVIDLQKKQIAALEKLNTILRKGLDDAGRGLKDIQRTLQPKETK